MTFRGRITARYMVYEIKTGIPMCDFARLTVNYLNRAVSVRKLTTGWQADGNLCNLLVM